MKAKFTIEGEPQGKGRPRFRWQKDPNNKKGGYPVTYTDDKTRAYEELVKSEYKKQCRGIRFAEGTILDLRIIAYYAIPKSENEGTRLGMECGVIRPTKTPDADNVIKAIADALNKLAYPDDKNIVDCQIRKFYSYQPRVEVTLLPAKNERREIT